MKTITKSEAIKKFARDVSGWDKDGDSDRPDGHDSTCFCATCRKYDAYRTVCNMIWSWERTRPERFPF